MAVALALAPELWEVVHGWSLKLDLGSSVSLPRAAGSPLLVVIASMLVLGMMAVFELTTSSES